MANVVLPMRIARTLVFITDVVISTEASQPYRDAQRRDPILRGCLCGQGSGKAIAATGIANTGVSPLRPAASGRDDIVDGLLDTKLSAYGTCNRFGVAAHGFFAFGFDHHARERFRAGVANDYAACVFQFFLCCMNCADH
jgi:hypothetical protein